MCRLVVQHGPSTPIIINFSELKHRETGGDRIGELGQNILRYCAKQVTQLLVVKLGLEAVQNRVEALLKLQAYEP